MANSIEMNRYYVLIKKGSMGSSNYLLLFPLAIVAVHPFCTTVEILYMSDINV